MPVSYTSVLIVLFSSDLLTVLVPNIVYAVLLLSIVSSICPSAVLMLEDYSPIPEPLKTGWNFEVIKNLFC